jgi:lysozyme family protein
MSSYTFEFLRKDYEVKWAACEIPSDKLKTVQKSVEQILKNKEFYSEAEYQTGCPWYFIGSIHSKECSCKMDSQIFNGEKWAKKTTLVPKGLGPWKSWIDSTIAALYGFKNINWTIERVLFELERWNGFGYRMKHPEVNSPYLWSHTNLYQKGGYSSDGVFDQNWISKNPGAASIIKFIESNTITIEKS